MGMIEHFTKNAEKYMGYVLDIIQKYEDKSPSGWVPSDVIASEWGNRFGSQKLPIQYMSWALFYLTEFGMKGKEVYVRHLPAVSYTTQPELIHRIRLAGRNVVDAVRRGIPEKTTVQLYADFEPFVVEGVEFPQLPHKMAADFFRRHEIDGEGNWKLVKDNEIRDGVTGEYRAESAGTAELKRLRNLRHSLAVTNRNHNSAYMLEGEFIREPKRGMRVPPIAQRKYYDPIKRNIINGLRKRYKMIVDTANSVVKEAKNPRTLREVRGIVKSYETVPVDDDLRLIISTSRSDEEARKKMVERHHKSPLYETHPVLVKGGAHKVLRLTSLPKIYRGVFEGSKAGKAERLKRENILMLFGDAIERIGEKVYRTRV